MNSPRVPVPADDSGIATTEVVACWSQIGVYGDRTCPELRTFVHCRNCPVYSAAGSRLLDRPLPPEYRRERTAHFALEKEIAPHTNVSALLFRIAGEWLALPTPALQEVAEPRLIHSVPHRHQGIVLGLVNIRGELLICASLGHLLGLEGLPARALVRRVHARLVVATWEGTRLVFPVDEVLGTHRLNLHELTSPPATVARAPVSYTEGVFSQDEKVFGLLAPALLFPALDRSLT